MQYLRQTSTIFFLSIFGAFIFLGLLIKTTDSQDIPAAPVPEFDILGEEEDSDELLKKDPEAYYRNWKRPDGPLKVGLQVGHWKNLELPDEFSNLREFGGGTKGGGKTEWEVCLAIAVEAKKVMEEKGIAVDLLPATIPPDYWADAVIAIHADGSEASSASGYKVAAPRRDISGSSMQLASILEEKYGELTMLRLDTNVTSNMRGYYAFNWRKYEHAIHPKVPAVILETGFLTNRSDRQLLVNNPSLPARAIADAIIDFLPAEK